MGAALADRATPAVRIGLDERVAERLHALEVHPDPAARRVELLIQRREYLRGEVALFAGVLDADQELVTLGLVEPLDGDGAELEILERLADARLIRL